MVEAVVGPCFASSSQYDPRHLNHRTVVSGVSALGQEQTSRKVRGMSVITLKADIRRCSWNVQELPKTDMVCTVYQSVTQLGRAIVTEPRAMG